MSGGRFKYYQYRLLEIIESIKQEIIDNESEPRKEYKFSEETIVEFKKGIEFLQKAQVYAHRIDWLLSGDDGEESFHKRLQKDLLELCSK